jgi:polysaccharide deacetylase family protein (PEP-CTERM system associated)
MKILTFDIEDWFHVLDNEKTKSVSSWSNFESRVHQGVEHILGLLDDCKQKHATFFCLGWVAENFPEVIQKIDNAGFHIASHSYGHQLAYEQSSKEFKNDLLRSINTIQDVTGKKVDAYRAPGFSITEQNQWAFSALIDCGIKFDCSVFPAKRAHGGLPNYDCAKPSVIKIGSQELLSFPINTASVFGKSFVYSGGGYFRLLPYSLISYLLNRDDYVMTYFHPRDFDVNQPLIPGVSGFRKFKSYVGIEGATTKLKRIIRENDFVDLPTASGLVAWSSAPKIKL